MRTGILLVGPRGSGKSTWAASLVQQHPEVLVFNRDKFFAANFPNGFDPYTNQLSYACELYWKSVSDAIGDRLSGTFVLDYFTGYERARRTLVKEVLRGKLGLDVVYAHVLLTSRTRTIQQYVERERIKQSGLNAACAAHDYDLFWKETGDIFPLGECKQCTFDAVRLIDPDDPQLVLPWMPLL